MDSAERKALEKNSRLLVVGTSSKASCVRAVEFCGRLGCSENTRMRNFSGIGDDKIIFVKRLS
jgi:hypothetical protein